MRKSLFIILLLQSYGIASPCDAETSVDAPPAFTGMEAVPELSEAHPTQPPESLWGNFALVPRDRLAADSQKNTQTYSLLDFADLLGKQAGWWKESDSPLRLGVRLKPTDDAPLSDASALDSALGRIGEFSIEYRPDKGPMLGFSVGQQPTDATTLEPETYYRWELGVQF